jgi:hypothetical protein
MVFIRKKYGDAPIEWCKKQNEIMEPCRATKHPCLNNWKHIHAIHVHIDKLCKEKEASRWDYVLAIKMFSYSTKDPMLACLLA